MKKQNNNKRVRKGLFPAMAMVALSFVASAGATYAWWNVFEVRKQNTLDVGSRVRIVVTETVTPDQGNLIPKGEPNLLPGDTHEILYNYSINIKDDASYLKTETYKFYIDIENVKLGGLVTYTEHFDFGVKHNNETEHTINRTFEYDPAIGDHNIELQVTLNLDKNTTLTEAQLDEIQNKKLQFDVVFALRIKQ